LLPIDIVAATSFSADADYEVVPADAIPADRMGLDIGPDSSALSRRSSATRTPSSGTVRWGAFEMAPFAAGTQALAECPRRADRLTVH
jgi:phosphoglycerate kinase